MTLSDPSRPRRIAAILLMFPLIFPLSLCVTRSVAAAPEPILDAPRRANVILPERVFAALPPVRTETTASVVPVVEATPTPVPAPVADAPLAVVPPVAQVAWTGNPNEWDALLQAHFGASWTSAKAVMLCESGGNPTRINDNPATGDYSVGLFQINLYGRLAASRPAAAWLSVGANNIAYAAQMWQTQGFRPWTCAAKLGVR